MEICIYMGIWVCWYWIDSSHNVTNMHQECRQLGNQADKLGRTPLILGLLSGVGAEAVAVMLELGEDPRKEDQVAIVANSSLYCRVILVTCVGGARLCRGRHPLLPRGGGQPRGPGGSQAGR